MISKLKQETNSFQEYKTLQKQLNDEHNRLLRQREKMLQRQNDRLVVYQKLDLVEFFNYSSSKTQNKQTMMYHLSEKFKNYMRKLTENNVYRRQEWSRRYPNSPSQLRGMSNVQRNSELGRMFQTMRYHEGDKLSSDNNPPLINKDNHSAYNDTCANGYRISNIQNTNLNNDVENQSTLRIQMQQLRSALTQQEKICMLSELNHYIRLYKQSQTKARFLNRHLENLHQFILEIKINQQNRQYQNQHWMNNNGPRRYRSKTKHCYNQQQQSTTLLQQQNVMLRKQLQIYIDEINAINVFAGKQQQLQLSTTSKCPQVKKVDRFKQFIQHISIIQMQLDDLISKVNNKKELSASNIQSNEMILIDELYRKIGSLESMIEHQESEKANFFQQVRKFKQLMNIKSQQIATLHNQLQVSQSLIDQLRKENNQLYTQLHRNSPTSNTNYNKLTPQLMNYNDDMSSFISRIMNKNQPYQQLMEMKHCREESTTTTTPSMEYSNSNVRISGSVNYRKDNYYCEPITERKSRSKSKHSVRSESKDSCRLKTGYTDSYEPKPYERYWKRLNENNIPDTGQSLSSTGPLYQRISND